MIRNALILLLLLTAVPFAGAADTTAVKTISIPASYMPKFHGTFRTFYEMSTTTGDSRFMVRNARLSAGGKVLPVAEYFFQVDLCDRGKIKILDAYVGVTPLPGLKITAGQSRVPFSVGASRAPALYHFANRASMCKDFGNLRAAGVKVGYTVPSTRLYFEGGAFNGTDMSDHTSWNRALTYSIKANYTTPGGLMPQICFMSRKPGVNGVRVNQADASVTFQNSAWFIEAEYCFRTYAGHAHKDAHGYNFEIDYGFPVRSAVVNRWSFQARFDGITDSSSGIPLDGVLVDNYVGNNRLTLGTTASYIKGQLHCDFRINYEQYFYPGDRKAYSPSDDNKLVAALVLYF